MWKKANTKLSEFKIAETKVFENVKKKLNKKLIEKIETIVYPQLKINPFIGINIKKLKGEFKGYNRYRIGNYRLFYLIDKKEKLVFIVDLKIRNIAYKK